MKYDDMRDEANMIANEAVLSTYLVQADVERAALTHWAAVHIHSSYWPPLASEGFATSLLPRQLINAKE